MIELHTAPTTNGLRPRIMLEECGLPYGMRVVDLAAGEHGTPAYLAINPMGLVPTLVDDDGPGGEPLVLSQSMTILTYLAGKSGRFLPDHLTQDMIFWRDAMSIGTDLSGTLQSALTIGRMAEPHGPTMDMFGKRFNDLLKVWDGMLGERRYCAGDEVTILDFALFPLLARCRAVAPRYAEGCPGVDRWFDEIGARPGVRRALEFGSG